MTVVFVCLLFIYSALSVFIVHFWRTKPSHIYPKKQETLLLLPILVLHGFWLWWPMLAAQQLLLGFGHAMAILSWMTLVWYWTGSFFYRLQGLQLFLFPFAVFSLLVDVLLPTYQAGIQVSNWAFASHIVSSLLAYSLFAVATLLALLLLWQVRHLRRHHLTPAVSFLPPLLSLEKLMFQALMVGFVLLTLSLISGMVFSEVVFGHVFMWTHKIIFGVASWCIYAAILFLRWKQGIRGKKVSMAVIVGFILLVLAYLGSKFVLEFILSAGYVMSA